MRTAVC